MQNSKGYFEFQVNRNMSRLSRGLLSLLEDLKAQQKINEDSLIKALPPEHHNLIKAANVLTEERVKLLRKRILDNTNDHSRDLLADLEYYEIEFNFEGKKV